MSDFADVVVTEIREPLQAVCKILADESNHVAYAFFANLLFGLDDPSDEAAVIMTVIELSKCAFLGFEYTATQQEAINELLDRAIAVSTTMSADGTH